MCKSFRVFLLAIALHACAGSAYAWNHEDTLWESTYLMAHIADWGQTRDIAVQCDSGAYYETNPIIGKCPTVNWVNNYFIATALAHVGIATMLPKKYRRLFQMGTLAMEVGYISNNARIGLRANF